MADANAPDGAPEHKRARGAPGDRHTLPPERDRSTMRLPALPRDEPRRDLARTPRPEGGAHLPAPVTVGETRPVIIRGTGKVPSVRPGHVPRRRRPLPLRLRVALILTTVGLVLGALFAVSPLGSGGADAAQGDTPFQALSGAVGWRGGSDFTWYTAISGDTVESIAQKFKCQVGGIYKMNNLLSGQEIEVGKAYKIPTDATYGHDYQAPSYVTYGGGYGTTIYGDHIWNSLAGIPPEGASCGPVPRGSGDFMGNYDLSSFDLKSPNWGAYWVRGFTWYHFGVDLANPAGTPIHAAQAGEVIFAGWDTGGGGWSVKINHCNHISTAYGHMEQLLVKVHDMVNVGDVVGLEGSTGWSTGPHLHFSVQWDNGAVDPMLFFGESKYNITHYLPDA